MTADAPNVPASSGAREGLVERLAEAIDKAACESMTDCSLVHDVTPNLAVAVLPLVAEAAVSAVRAERDRALRMGSRYERRWDRARQRAESAEAERDALREKVARVEAGIVEKGKLHATWDHRMELVVTVDDLRAALSDPTTPDQEEGA